MVKTNRKIAFLGSIIGLMLLSSCATKYKVASLERSRILVDKRYDSPKNAELQTFIAPYKVQVDSIMSPVVGRVAHDMAAHKPESDLSNLMSDILVWGSKRFNETPDFAVYNMGGIRAAFAKGDVTRGNVLDVAPFVNKLCVLSLTGEKVKELFEQIAAVGGDGVSHGVKLVITRDRKLKSATVNGEEIKTDKTYRIATLDYLAKGNDGLTAFKSRTNVVKSDDELYNVRYIIEDYFRDATKQGKVVDAQVEGRIVVE